MMRDEAVIGVVVRRKKAEDVKMVPGRQTAALCYPGDPVAIPKN